MRDGQWIESNHDFVVPPQVFSEMVRESFRQRLQKARPDIYARIKPSAWEQEWKVFNRRYEVNELEELLKYLSKFIYRVAITRSQLLKMDDDTVTYRYRDREANEYRQETLLGADFLRKFLRHVLPKSFHKTREGCLHHYSRRNEFALAVEILKEKYPDTKVVEDNTADIKVGMKGLRETCPHCGSDDLVVLLDVRYNEHVPQSAYYEILYHDSARSSHQQWSGP